jgi:hypothetical protein
MEQSPSWEAKRFSDSQEISRILWNPKEAFTSAHHLSPWARSIHSMPPSNFLRVHFNIIFPSTPGSSKRSLSLSFPRPNRVCTTTLPIRVTCPAHLILLGSITRIVFAEEYRSFSSSLPSLLHFPVTSFHLSSYILLVTLFSNTFSPHPSLNESDQVSHPYNTRGKFILIGGRSSTWNLRTRHAAVTVRTYHGA